MIDAFIRAALSEKDLTPKRGRPPLSIPDFKTCVICHEEKPISLFYRQPNSNYVGSYCDTCRAEYMKQWNAKNTGTEQQKELNRAKIRERGAAYRKHMKKLGIGMYIPIQKRYAAIMQLI